MDNSTTLKNLQLEKIDIDNEIDVLEKELSTFRINSFGGVYSFDLGNYSFRVGTKIGIVLSAFLVCVICLIIGFFSKEIFMFIISGTLFGLGIIICVESDIEQMTWTKKYVELQTRLNILKGKQLAIEAKIAYLNSEDSSQ